MRQAGRKSSEQQFAVVPLPGTRHEPPKTFTKQQAIIWRAVVATKPSSWFTEDSHPLLIAYCRHSVTADILSAKIDRVEAGEVGDYKLLLAMREHETAMLLKLASAMRLTQHSRLKSETAATQANNVGGANKPWS